jgi:sialate O-acetylesterase
MLEIKNIMNKINIFFLLTFLTLIDIKIHGAEVSSMFNNNMVLQRDMPVSVWGTGKPDEEVIVKFADQEKSTKVGADGRWLIKLDPMAASAESRTLSIHSATGTQELTNVLVGEVWLASGQSNMNYWMFRSPRTRPLIEHASDPHLRLMTIPYAHSEKPLESFRAGWAVCSPKSVNFYSAVAYIFAREIRASIQVPVGIIQSTVGGTPAEAWTSQGALEDDPVLKRILTDAEEQLKRDLAAAEIENQPALTKYNEALEKAKAEGNKHKPRMPKLVQPAASPLLPYRLYNGMIAPIVPFSFRGVIWYQGESNSKDPELYRTLFPALIQDWRKNFGRDFPFYFVQIAPYKDIPPELREAQLFTWKTVPNTSMVVITDHGEAKNIHPENKEPVGIRLALTARALTYGEKIVYSGPLFEKLRIEGDRAILYFQHIGDGLMSQGESLTGFEISSDGTNYVPAIATIQGDTVVVTSENLKSPVSVRYGWANVPNGNLFNKNGLPATPFRTSKK